MILWYIIHINFACVVPLSLLFIVEALFVYIHAIVKFYHNQL